MDISVKHGIITIENPETFSVWQTFCCGQLFRYKLDGDYAEVYALDKKAVFHTEKDRIHIFAEDENFFLKYLDFGTNYGIIVSEVQDKGLVSAAAEFGKGIRILRQDPVETIISFIISANNHIPRIRGIIERLCENLGEKKDGWYAFPEVSKLASQDADFYFKLGAGYRAPYLAKTAQLLSDGFDLEKVRDADTAQAHKMLCSLPGVGPKVADCILLFGFGKTDVFPVDTWIKKVFVDIFGYEAPVKVMREELVKRYGRLSGYVQQYLYFYKREYNHCFTK